MSFSSRFTPWPRCSTQSSHFIPKQNHDQTFNHSLTLDWACSVPRGCDKRIVFHGLRYYASCHNVTEIEPGVFTTTVCTAPELSSVAIMTTMGSNPVGASEFWGLYLSLLKVTSDCEDLFHFYSPLCDYCWSLLRKMVWNVPNLN